MIDITICLPPTKHANTILNASFEGERQCSNARNVLVTQVGNCECWVQIYADRGDWACSSSLAIWSRLLQGEKIKWFTKNAFARKSQRRMCCTHGHKIYYPIFPEYAVPSCMYVASSVSKQELQKEYSGSKVRKLYRLYSPPLRQFFFSLCLLLVCNHNPTCPQFSKVSDIWSGSARRAFHYRDWLTNTGDHQHCRRLPPRRPTTSTMVTTSTRATTVQWKHTCCFQFFIPLKFILLIFRNWKIFI